MTCRIQCNAGTVTTRLVGDLPGYPAPVWFHKQGIANILSLNQVAKHYHVTYNSDGPTPSFIVTKPDGSMREFHRSVTGLHYSDTAVTGTALVTTVADTKSNYSVRSYRQAVLARRIQNIIGRPSTRDYIKIVEGGMLNKCPVTRVDIMAAEDIFGPNLGSLKGKTVRRKGGHVQSLVADVPYSIIKRYQDITLCFDIMFGNKVAFLVTVSRNVRNYQASCLSSGRRGWKSTDQHASLLQAARLPR